MLHQQKKGYCYIKNRIDLWKDLGGGLMEVTITLQLSGHKLIFVEIGLPKL